MCAGLGAERWVTAIAGAVVAALTAVLVWRAGSIFVNTELNADLIAPLVMGEAAHRYADAQLVTGRLGWWGGLWIVQLLRPLPGGMEIATWLPFAGTIAVTLAVAWQARRVWSPLAAAVLALAALSVGPMAWAYDASWSARSPSWWTMALAGLAAVALARGPRPGAVALAGVALVWGAICASGDQLVLIGAAAPLAACAAYAAWRRAYRLAGALAGGAVAMWLGSLVVASLAERAGYLRQSFPVELISLSQLGTALDHLVEALQDVWRTPATWTGDLGVLLVAAAALSGLAALVVAWRRRGPAPGGARELERGLWVTFWVVALLAYLAAFTLTTVGGLAGVQSVRYLYGVPLAAAATLAAAIPSARSLGPVVAAGVAVLAVAVTWQYARNPPTAPPLTADLSRSALYDRIEQIAREEGVTRGFASYWTAYPLTWRSGGAVDVTPIGTCGDGWCPMYLHYIDRAYEPQPVERSFVLIDGSPLARGGFWGAWATDLAAGVRPTKVVDVGDGVRMAIFEGDVARSLRPNAGLLDPRVGHGGPLEPR